MKEKTVKNMSIVAVVGQKGGIGKTTIAIHLAVAATRAGHTTVLMDLDPQASASKWSDIRTDDAPVVISAHATRLRHVIDKAEANGVTFVVLDTPPQLESPITDAAKVADLALIPCRPALFDIHAIEETVYRTRKENVPTHLVFNAVPARSSMLKQAKEVVADYNIQIAPCTVGRRILFSHAVVDGKTAEEFDPKSKAAAEIQTLYTYLEEQLTTQVRSTPDIHVPSIGIPNGGIV
ncbi:AAA family ATPase [Candidatus Poribacteria bacterium]|nr:AAA family ATPase [Candidatus Poribacteria bacterium]